LSEDNDYFKGYVKGYVEGLNKAWDELIGLTTRNYSSREIQVMAKSKRQSIDQMMRSKMKQIEEDEGRTIFSQPTRLSLSSKVEPGRSYLMTPQGFDRAVAVFNEMVAGGKKGMCIVRHHPPEVRGLVAGEPRIYWLTKQEFSPGDDGGLTPEDYLSPSELPKIITVIRQFLKDSKGGVLLLEGTEYMVIQNDFNAVLKFLCNLRDQNITGKGVLLLPVDQEAMDAQEFKVLERSIENRL
jgi:hypothetical protein